MDSTRSATLEESRTLKKIWIIILIVLILTGCTVNPSETSTPNGMALIESTMPEPSLRAPTASTPSPNPTFSPTPSPTTSPIPSHTSLPTITPTITQTPTPEVISLANIDRLEQQIYELPVLGRLQSAKWSHDGNLVLVTAESGTYLLDSLSLDQVEFFSGMLPIIALEDSKWLVYAQGKRQYLAFEGDQYQLLPVPAEINELGMNVISRNGEVAAQKSGENEIEIINIKTGERRTFNLREAGYQFNYIQPLLLSPDGKILIIQDSYWSDCYIVNLEKFEVSYKLTDLFSIPIFSPDGQFISITDRGGIKVIKANNGIQYNRFSDGFIVRPTPRTHIYYGAVAYAYLPDSKHVGVVYCVENQRCELYIWSIDSGQAETIVKDLPPGIQAVDFSPDGKSFLTITSDGFIRTWDITSHARLAESQPYDRGKPVVSSEGRLVAIPRGNQIVIFNLETGKSWKMIGNYLSTTSLMVDSITESRMVVSGYDRGTGAFAELWDLTTNELVRKFNPLDFPNTHSNDPYCKIDTDGKLIACGSNPLQIFDVQTGGLLFSNKDQEKSLAWALSPDGNLLATCTVAYKSDTHEIIPGGQIYLLNVANNTFDIESVFEASQGRICSEMIFSSSGQFLASLSGFIWKLDQHQPQASFTTQTGAPMAFSPDDSLLISGNWVILANTGEKVAELEINGRVEMIGFDADGYELIFKTDQGVEIWSIGSK